MGKNINSNLLFNYDENGTEANVDIIKNVKVKSTTKQSKIEETFNEPKKLLNETSDNFEILPKNKLDILVLKLPKKELDKKTYMTIYLKKSIQNKIDDIAKKLNISNGLVIELIINEFEKK